METTTLCRCCLLRPPDKDLRTPYVRLEIGVPEVYMDMLEKCFEIHVMLANDGSCGICSVCVGRLRDASDFKLQVQRSQAELQARLAALHVKDEEPEIKSETAENRTSDVLLPDVLSEEGNDGTNGDMLDEGPAVQSETGAGVPDPGVISEKENDGTAGDLAPELISEEESSVTHSDAIESACDEHEPRAARWDHTYARTDFPDEIVSDTFLDARTANAREQLAMTCSVARDRPGDEHESFTEKPSLIDQKPYHCEICSVEFSSEINFTDHLTTHIGPKGNCGICHEDFPSTPALISHIIKHTGQCNGDICSVDHTPYACDICNVNFTDPFGLRNHIKTHTENKPFLCNYCNKKCVNSIDLRQHERTHTDEKLYSCNICKEQFKLEASLKKHMLVHTEERPFPCKYCDKKFEDSDRLKKHTIIHSVNRKYYKHIRSHTESVLDLTSFSCGICKKQFTTRTQLLRHIKIHTDQKPFLCEFCSKGFRTRTQLKRHTISHTGEKAYVCQICKKQFALKSNLAVHMRIHTLEFPYSCDFCCKKFNDRSNWKKHIRIHTGEKPYGCKICNKRFTCSRGLFEHGRVHSGDRPYSCKECSWQFKRIGHLRKHYKRFHAREKVHNSEEVGTPGYSMI